MEKKIIFLSHCIINQYARAKGVKNKYEDNPIVLPIINLLIKNGVAIIQIPCPEIEYEGLNREACGKKRYKNPEYYRICNIISKKVIDLYKEYRQNCKIIGFIGIKNSPTCETNNCSNINDRDGIFYEILKTKLIHEKIQANYVDIDMINESLDNSIEKINTLFEDRGDRI